MKYKHILWCRDEKANADKVWGIILLQEGEEWSVGYRNPSKYATFWGRRGKALQTKIWEGYSWDSNEMKRKKCNKGYRVVDPTELDTLYPEFESDLEKTAVWALLKA
jgi:hypothetical protein